MENKGIPEASLSQEMMTSSEKKADYNITEVLSEVEKSLEKGLGKSVLLNEESRDEIVNVADDQPVKKQINNKWQCTNRRSGKDNGVPEAVTVKKQESDGTHWAITIPYSLGGKPEKATVTKYSSEETQKPATVVEKINLSTGMVDWRKKNDSVKKGDVNWTTSYAQGRIKTRGSMIIQGRESKTTKDMVVFGDGDKEFRTSKITIKPEIRGHIENTEEVAINGVKAREGDEQFQAQQADIQAVEEMIMKYQES
ncbi:hypothetical protein ACFL2B_01920 [Patescibacteria group bacterium]